MTTDADAEKAKREAERREEARERRGRRRYMGKVRVTHNPSPTMQYVA